MLAIAALMSPGNRLFGGEPIVFGSTKVKVEPNKEKVPIQKAFGLDKLSSPAPLEMDGLTPPILPRLNTNRKKDKRQQNAEDENKNWMLLEKGELQDQDDEKNFLGVRDQDLDDNTKNNHDFTFRDRDSQTSRLPGQPRSASPSQSRLPSQSQVRSPGQHRKIDANQPPPREDLDEDTKREPRSSAIIFGRLGSQAGERLGKDVDMKRAFESRGEVSGKSDFSLRDFLNTSDSPRSREQQARMESFKQILSSPDPLSGRADFSRPLINPAQPYSSGVSLPNSTPRSLGNESFILRANPGQGSTVNFLTPPDAGSRPSSFGAPPSGGPGWKPTPVEWPRARF